MPVQCHCRCKSGIRLSWTFLNEGLFEFINSGLSFFPLLLPVLWWFLRLLVLVLMPLFLVANVASSHFP